MAEAMASVPVTGNDVQMGGTGVESAGLGSSAVGEGRLGSAGLGGNGVVKHEDDSIWDVPETPQR